MSCCGESTIIDGALGLAKAALGIDQTEPEVLEKRQSTCAACSQNGGLLCMQCRCVIAAKVRVASEKCPAGKW